MNDHQLQQRLLETEVSPPGRVWDLLAAELDDLQQLAPAGNQLRSMEIPPPASVWATISTSIEEENSGQWFRESLQYTEMQPPANVWSELEARLTEQQMGQQLADLQLPAPAAAWQQIHHQLDMESGAKEKAPVLKLQTWVRVAAAAVITGLLLWSSSLLFDVNEDQTQVPPVAQLKEPAGTTVEPLAATVEPTKETPALTTRKQVVKKKTAVTTGLTTPIQAPEHDSPLLFDETTTSHRLKRFETVADNSAFEEGKYLVLLDDDGELVRVSKRLMQMKCVNGNGENIQVEVTAALQSRNCENQIKKWQEKIAQSAVLSAGGYFDLQEVIQTTEK